jgi:hypothetical protein
MDANQYFDSDLLHSFMNTFYGYGNNQADYWLVGMEEGGGNSVENIQLRLQTWKNRGEHEFEDLAEYHNAIGVPQLFTNGEGFKLQRTWNKLIRILMAVEGHEPSLDDVKAFQRTKLGRQESNTCLPELLPLPSRSVKEEHWLYGKHSKIDYLTKRESYRKQLAETRANHIRNKIRNAKPPKAVIFYSLSKWYVEWWKYIAGVNFTESVVDKFKLYIGSNDDTVFAMTTHPAAKGITSSYFHQVGQTIAKNLKR